MNWEKISDRYRDIGLNLIEKTNEGTSGLKKGMAHGVQDYSDMRRTHKILLRVGFEFLLKAMYIKNGWNIYYLKGKSLVQIKDLHNLNAEPILDLNRTFELSFLANNLSNISIASDIQIIKDALKKIIQNGNDAVHKENEIENVKELKDKIIKLMEK